MLKELKKNKMSVVAIVATGILFGVMGVLIIPMIAVIVKISNALSQKHPRIYKYSKGKVNVGMFVTMNATQEFYDKMYKKEFEHYMDEFKRLNGDVVLYPCYNTLQVSDYSKFNMSSFDENVKKKTHDELFPMDLQNAYNLGYQLSR